MPWFCQHDEQNCYTLMDGRGFSQALCEKPRPILLLEPVVL